MLGTAASAATHFISTTGSDSLPGTSLSLAWATFAHAWTVVRPGDTLLIADGTYHQQISPAISGTSAAHITIQAINDGQAVIDGDTNGDGIGELRAPLELGGPGAGWQPINYIDVSGLVVKNAGPYCPDINDPNCDHTSAVVFIWNDHNTVRRVSAYNAHPDKNSTVIWIMGSDNLVEDCVAAGYGRKMIMSFSSATRDIIRRCFSASQDWHGIEFNPGYWPWMDGNEFYGTSHSIFENNIVYGMTAGPSSGFGANEQSTTTISQGLAYLGNMVVRAGKKWNNDFMTWPCPSPYRSPAPGCPDMAGWDWRSAYSLGGLAFQDILYQDSFAWGNAGRAFAINGGGPFTNISLIRATFVNNALAPGENGLEISSGALGLIQSITDSYIAGTSYQGGGARLRYRYQSYFNGDTAVPTLTTTNLWPWPMEDRIKNELGVHLARFLSTNPELQNFSVTATMQSIFNSLPAAINPLVTTPDTQAPTVSMTAPAAGSILSGSRTLAASASDNVGVAGVQFLVDGANAGAEVTAAPYTLSLDTTPLSNGAHVLSARARDAAGNSAVSAGVNVTVDNTAAAGLAIAGLSDNRAAYANAQVPRYSKLEISFQVNKSVAGNFQLPYDPAPPAGVDPANYPLHKGISVDGLFTPDNWQTVYRQPAFYSQIYQDAVKYSWEGANREWHYPSGTFAWKVRFAPNRAGSWQYKIVARDASGSAESAVQSFTVAASASPGFLHVSQADPRYFEFDNGQPFVPEGINLAVSLPNPVSANEPVYQGLSQNRMNFQRVWISSLYGSAWLEWLGGRNLYDGYLPRAGLEPFHDPLSGRDQMTQVLMYNDPTGWYDACRFQFWNDPEAVKQNTNYKLSIRYWGTNVAGPRLGGNYGLVGKLSTSSFPNCEEPGTGTVITPYGQNTVNWGVVEGTWNSGSNNFVPRIYLALENVTQGKAYISSVSLREDLGNGQYGPEILNQYSMQYELYFAQGSSYSLDKVIELAERYGIYLKLVLSDKDDKIYYKLDDDGTFVIGGEPDNLDGFYGLGRGMNKTRWLQQAWWRYAQARWGYSTAIHSWELTNEGDPYLTQHWELTDELGKFMHCRVFGVDVGSGDAAGCSYQHPNRHMATTSFWTGFPGYSAQTRSGFWGNPNYPNVDYADVHAYISTSEAPLAERSLMEGDSAYYHLWHSNAYGGWNLRMPVVRGEAGMDQAEAHGVSVAGLQDDRQGYWYHDYLWSGLDSGALYELYWWYTPDIYNAGVYDHRPVALAVQNFLNGVALNNGHYQELGARVSDQNLRVVGQKDLVNGKAHLWIQNKNHTWRNAANGVSIAPVSGTVQIGGFAPTQAYALEWWDTYGGQVSSTTSATAAADGTLTLSLAQLATDLAVKIMPQETAPVSRRSPVPVRRQPVTQSRPGSMAAPAPAPR